MEKKELLYEGKSKNLYKTDDANLLVAEFKDKKVGAQECDGVSNSKISTKVFNLLENEGIKTHLVKMLGDKNQLIKKLRVLPIKLIVRNIATGSLVERLGVNDGEELTFPLVELYYKNDDLGDPLINSEHCIILGITKTLDDLNELRQLGREINVILRKFFKKCDLKLVDFKVEFGADSEGNIFVCDEIGLDNCRLWDINNAKVTYEEIVKRVLNSK